MSSRYKALRGNSVELIATFTDSLGNLVDPTGLTVSLYPPGSNPDDEL